MVRINLINPRYLTDQHLIAEYLEIIMLISYIKKFQNNKVEIPIEYCLGKGHMLFFKDKVLYLKKRHEQIKEEMSKRGFKTNKKINIKKINKNLLKDYKVKEKDLNIIRKRLIEKINKKPSYYRYYGENRDLKFLMGLTKK
jgi:deoxyribonuclease (pyrimidine dimer)